MVVHEADGLKHIADVLAHLAALLIEDMAQAEDISVGRAVEHEGADGHERVEPASGLVDCLADEVGRVLRRKCTSIDMRVSDRGEWHGS